MTVGDFNVQQNLIASAEEALDLARTAHTETRQRFMIGKADISSLTLALQRRQEAQRNYIAALRKAITRHHTREFLGMARTDDDRRIRLVIAPQTGDGRGFDPSQITLAAPGGHLIRLDQLLTVRRQEEAPRSYYRINGLNSIYLSFLADESANQLQLAAKVKAEMDAIRLRLPAGYEIHTGYDATEYIREELDKINQQYRLCLQYEYIGAANPGRKFQERILDEFNVGLPMGYVAKGENYQWRWGEKDRGQYALLLLIVVIIFFMTGILFNSLKQPLAVIGVIPVSYIGVFLTFYLFRLNFDQGGFASFVLLCGITVNAGIYILDEYNSIRRRKPLMPPLRAYLKAWNAKVTPIFLTVVSTVLGFIPSLPVSSFPGSEPLFRSRFNRGTRFFGLFNALTVSLLLKYAAICFTISKKSYTFATFFRHSRLWENLMHIT
jgi:multidrug efflux pump subunit AcrB